MAISESKSTAVSIFTHEGYIYPISYIELDVFPRREGVLRMVSDGAVAKIIGYGFSRLSGSRVWVESVLGFKKNCRLRFNAVIKKTSSVTKVVGYLLVGYADNLKEF